MEHFLGISNEFLKTQGWSERVGASMGEEKVPYKTGEKSVELLIHLKHNCLK